MSSASEAVLRRFYDEVFTGGRVEVVDELVAADCVEHPPPPGTAGGDVRAMLKEFVVTLRGAIPDLRVVPGQIVTAGDLTAAYFEATGTHVGELFGEPPTGMAVSFQGIDMVRVAGGRCTDHWGFDNLLTRIGAAVARTG